MRKEKQLLLDEIKSKIETSPGFVVASYSALKSSGTLDLRRAVKASGGDFEVVGKRIFWRAAESSGIKIALDDLEGHIAIAFSGEDTVASTKSICEFAADNKDNIKIRLGFVDGKILSASDILALSKLPGKNEMRAQLVGLFQAPLAKFLSVGQAALTGVIHCLKNKSETDSSN